MSNLGLDKEMSPAREAYFTHWMSGSERRNNLDWFMEHEAEFGPEDYWRILSDVWTMADTVFRNVDWFLFYFEGGCSQDTTKRAQYVMGEKDRAALEALPDEFPVYRGCLGTNKNGISWTLNREIAEWFARRFKFPRKRAYVITGTVKKADVIAYFNDREEKEIVIDWTKVTAKTATRLLEEREETK